MAMIAVLAEFPAMFWLFAKLCTWPLPAPTPPYIVLDALVITRELSTSAAVAASATFTFGYFPDATDRFF